MPQERDSQYPMPTAAQVAEAPGDPATKAARNIMVRHITGIPRRPFLLGENDSAPILQSVADLTRACYRLADALGVQPPGSVHAPAHAALGDLLSLLGDHGCPEEPVEKTDG